MPVLCKPKSKHMINTVFYDAQFSKSNHPSCKKVLREIYRITNTEEFIGKFIDCLKVCLEHEEKSGNVERTLDFAADFAVSFSLSLEEDETCPLLEGVFQFIFEYHNYNIPLIRLRICQLMNRLLDNMGHDATVVEETYNRIAESMLVRLQDSMSSVRTQAVYALHRLQSPSDPKCSIIQAFIYHMTHDPCHDVRRAVIQKIAVNKATLASILTRMNDVKDSVRKEAYVVISKLLIRQFTIKQRQLILQNGLQDKSDVAHDYVIRVLIPNWLKYFNYNYYEFLECIHVEKISDVGIKLLKSIFGKQNDVILESRVKNMIIVNQKIPYDKLNIITVVYWRALAEYVRPTDDSDKYEHIFQQVLPDLTPFCNYIKRYYFRSKGVDQFTSSTNHSSLPKEQLNETVNSSDREKQSPDKSENSKSSPILNENDNQESICRTIAEENKDETNSSPKIEVQSEKDMHVPDEAVLVHLLEMCKVYDLTDEMGRTTLKQLCVDFLQSPDITIQSVPVLTSLLDYTLPREETKLCIMAEIVSELREPLPASSEYEPDLLAQEAQDKKVVIEGKLAELETEKEIAQELNDDVRVNEIKITQASLRSELNILNVQTPHEPGRNENNDPATLIKCLTIIVQILRKGNIYKMNPTLYSLMHNFVIPTLNLKINENGTSMVKNLALEALSIFCVMDSHLAKEHFMMFCFNIANETTSVTALESVFDLLHVYGLSMFNIEDPDKENTVNVSEDEGSHRPNLIVLLMSLLISESPDMRKTAVLGLCKLLLAGRIKSDNLISKLITLWYNPLAESDPHIRQPLGVFFQVFANNCPHAPSLLLKAFIPTMKEFFKLEVTDPLMEVDVESVANLFVELTRPNTNKHENKEQSIHNQMAVNICEEVLSEDLESGSCIVLMKVLNHLELNFDLTTDISILSALASRMVKAIPKEEKTLVRAVVKFEMMLKVQQENNKTLSTINNTLFAEPSLNSNATKQSSQLLVNIKDDSGSESEVEDEEELSQVELMSTVCTTMDDSEMIEVPGTPESSDLESDSSLEMYAPALKKSARLGDSQFKFPGAPPLQTPRKNSFKVPTKTPKKSSAKTPAKICTSSQSRSSNTSLDTSSNQTFVKTPAKVSQPTPTKIPAKNSSRVQSASTPAKGIVEIMETVEKTSSQDTPVSDRVTRSSRKRKS